MPKVFDDVTIYDEMIGKTFKIVYTDHDQELIFELANGDKYIFYHEQDCCENVIIEDIAGELIDLCDAEIYQAESVTQDYKPTDAEMEDFYGDKMWTFYKFATSKGFVTVRWMGESNGYYSIGVSMRIEKKQVDA